MRESFRRLLARQSSEAEIRRAAASDSGYDPALWRAVADLGATALVIPADRGGLGGGPVEVESLMEEAGAALLCAPLLSSGVLATALVSASTDASARERILPRLASGESIATVVFGAARTPWAEPGIEARASFSAKAWRLDGSGSFALDAGISDTLIVIARYADEIGCFAVPARGAGVTVRPQKTWDPTVRVSDVDLRGAEALRLDGLDWASVEDALDLARVALMGQQVGGARRIFEITIDYIKTRIQFGRPVGGFQAIKHMAAELLLELESATSAARAAARALAERSVDREALVALGAFTCKDMFVRVASDAIQMHGGIAFTWEHPAHLYLRRARTGAQLFGPASAHREAYLGARERRLA
jgi:alkylation response protein AidB-like acyl-CoA dehydrogenase